ncbi:11016_t:CDS:2, partial [Diversispora eburnea]
AQILKAQNMITIMTKTHLLEENEEKIKLRKIVGDGGIDLFEEIESGIISDSSTSDHQGDQQESMDKTVAPFISKEPTNIKSNIKNNSDIKKIEVTVTIEQSEVIINNDNDKSKEKQIDIEELTIDIEENNENEWTEVINKKKKAKNTDNIAIDPEVIEEDKESVVSYEMNNSFHSDWRQDLNAKNSKFELTLKKFLEN